MDGLPVIDHYLETNDAPSDDEIIALKGYIADKNATVETLDRQMEEMMATLEKMKGEKGRHLSDIQRAYSALSPIRRVPADVLISIFIHCLSRIESDSESDSMGSRTSSSVTISLVSRYWRSLALNTPQLWSQLDINIPSISPLQGIPSNDLEIDWVFQRWSRRIENLRQVVEVSTQRSATCAILLSIRREPSDASSFPRTHLQDALEQLGALVKSLRVSSKRWRYLDVKLSPNFMTNDLLPLFDLPQADYGSLLRLRLCVEDNPHLAPEAVTSQVVRLASSAVLMAPSLHSIHIDGLWPNWNATAWARGGTTRDFQSVLALRVDQDISWRHSTDTNFRNHNIVDTLELLKLFPRLNECCLRFHDNARTPVGLTHVTLPLLRSVTVIGPPLRRGFSSSLDLPQLASLRVWALACSHMLVDEEDDGFLELVSRYGGQLSDLSIFYSALTPISVMAHLGSAPNVRKLFFSGTHPSSSPSSTTQSVEVAIFEALGLIDICPNLETFTMHCIRNYAQDGVMERAAVGFIASRCQQRDIDDDVPPGETRARASRLRVVALVFFDAQKIDILQELRDRNVDLRGIKLTLGVQAIQYPLKEIE